MPEPDCFLRYRISAATRNFTSGKSHVHVLAAWFLERAVVLKWFYSLSRRTNFVGGTRTLPSALLVSSSSSSSSSSGTDWCQFSNFLWGLSPGEYFQEGGYLIDSVRITSQWTGLHTITQLAERCRTAGTSVVAVAAKVEELVVVDRCLWGVIVVDSSASRSRPQKRDPLPSLWLRFMATYGVFLNSFTYLLTYLLI